MDISPTVTTRHSEMRRSFFVRRFNQIDAYLNAAMRLALILRFVLQSRLKSGILTLSPALKERLPRGVVAERTSPREDGSLVTQ